MEIFKYIIIGIIVLLALLAAVYFFLIFKLKNLKDKIYKYKEEKIIKEKNVLIIYQPSRHGTINKIKNLVKDEVIKKGYGVNVHTLCKEEDEYNDYQYTVFIVPVYFAEVNVELVNKVKSRKIKNLIIIYNGLNMESSKEDELVKKNSLSKYSKLKLHTNDIENVLEFINKEVY